MIGSATIVAAAYLPTVAKGAASEQPTPSTPSNQSTGEPTMSAITTKDGVQIFYNPISPIVMPVVILRPRQAHVGWHDGRLVEVPSLGAGAPRLRR